MSVVELVDSAMDRTVVPGYSKMGLVVRRRLAGWQADLPRMDGKVVVVTGAASGIGLAATLGFAELGATVLGVVRSDTRARELEAEAARSFGAAAASVRTAVCDVSSLSSIREFARQLGERYDHIDVLVNNAGVMPPQRQVTADGVELAFATHVLGPYVLINELTELLSASSPGRVINVTSGGMYVQHLASADLQTERCEYGPTKVYARSKRAQVILTEEMADRLGGRGIAVHSMHPGWLDTPGVQGWMPLFLTLTRPIIRTPAQGADTILWLGATDPATTSTGKLWQDRHQRPTHYRRRTRETPAERRELMDTLEALAGPAN